MNLSSARSVFNVGTSTYLQGALCTVTANGSTIFSKVLHPSPSGDIVLNLPRLLSCALSSDLSATVSYSVTYNGTSIDTGTFEYKI